MIDRRCTPSDARSTARRPRTVLIAAVLLLGLAVASCSHHRGEGQPATSPNQSVITTPGSISIAVNPAATGRRLEIFGDSITVISSRRFVAAFGKRYRLSLDAQHGARTAGVQPLIEAAAEEPPDIVVINLGTNDVACDQVCADVRNVPAFDATVVDDRFDHFFKLFPSSTCVIFVNINTHNPWWGPARAVALNAHLATFPHVVDWNGAWQPGWFNLPGDPHPNARGQQALIALISAQIATCPAMPVLQR